MKYKVYISGICRLLLILLWSYVTVAKLSDFEAFTFSLSRQPLPQWSVGIISIGIPLVEIIAILLLISEKLKRTGFIVSLVLMLAFSVYVALALTGAFGKIPCSCGGIISSLGWRDHLLFNLGYVIIAWIGYRWDNTKPEIEESLRKAENNRQLA